MLGQGELPSDDLLGGGVVEVTDRGRPAHRPGWQVMPGSWWPSCSTRGQVPPSPTLLSHLTVGGRHACTDMFLSICQAMQSSCSRPCSRVWHATPAQKLANIQRWVEVIQLSDRGGTDGWDGRVLGGLFSIARGSSRGGTRVPPVRLE